MTVVTEPSAPRTARQRVRAELTTEIKDIARRHLAESGAAGLSLRAVSREMGMVSSALYRYYPSRDDLLTALIVDAYDALGASAEAAEAAVRRPDLMGRWLALATAAREWAMANPQQWALIFGSPVPGYRAPTDTVDPAARIPVLLLSLGAEAYERRGREPLADERPVPRSVHADLKGLRELAGFDLPDPDLAHGIAAWAALVGSISFELFGHLHNVVHDFEAFFTHQMRAIGIDLGLA
jgi:AcrR family transcriptional regulator